MNVPANTSQPHITQAPDGFRWPGGRQIAVAINIAYEAWSDGKAPGITLMGNPLPPGNFDYNSFSWGQYGEVNGIRRLLRVLDRNRVRGSIMISGILAERAPDEVRAIIAAGHEYSAHSYAQDLIPGILDAEQDTLNIQKTTEILEAVTGKRPEGWISPRNTASNDTARRLVEAGYKWHSDVLNADLPYIQTFDNGQITAVPFSLEVNDLAHATRFGKTPRQYVEIFDHFLEQSLAIGDSTVVIEVTAHTHCYGRAGAFYAFEGVVKKCADRDDIWLATRGDIYDHFHASLG